MLEHRCALKCSTFNAVFQPDPSQRRRLSLRASHALPTRVRGDMHAIEDLAQDVLITVEVTSSRALLVTRSPRNAEGVHRRRGNGGGD